MKNVRVVRCPKCGSTNAGADEAGSMYDLTRMVCADCGESELADHWQIQFDWNTEIEMPDDVTTLPRFVAPLDPRFALFARMPEDTTVPAIAGAPAQPKPNDDE